MTEKIEAPEPIIELIETIPTQYIIAALVAGVVIGVVLLLLVDDAARKVRSEGESDA